MANPNDQFIYGTGFPEDSIYEGKYRDMKRQSLSELSFYKSLNAGGRRISEHRNISSDITKKENMKILLSFLSWQEYPNLITTNDLQNPHRSLLISIWNFIFKRIDKSIEINTKNANDEVPRIFKELGYPLAISKSSMVAPGTGHQWAHHLTALCWLCELLIYENEVFPRISEVEFKHSEALIFSNSQIIDSPSKDLISTHISLNKLISKNFVPCIIGKENKHTVKNIVLSQLEIDLEALRTLHSQKSNEMSNLQTNLQQMEAIMEEHKRKGNQITEMELTHEKLGNEISELKNQTSLIENEIKLQKKLIQTKSEELEAEKKQIDEISLIVSNQTITKEEVKQIKNSIDSCKNTLKQHNETLVLFKKEESNIEEKSIQLGQELQSLCTKMSIALSERSNTSETFKSPASQIWKQIQTIHFNYDANSLDTMLGIDWKRQKQLLKDVCIGEEEYLHKIKSEVSPQAIITAQNNLQYTNDKLASSKKEKEILKKKFEDLEQTMTKKYKEIQNEIEKNKNFIEEKENNLQNELNKINLEYSELQETLNNQNQKFEFEISEKWTEIKQLCKELAKAKIESINGFKRLDEIKKKNLEKAQSFQESQTNFYNSLENKFSNMSN